MLSSTLREPQLKPGDVVEVADEFTTGEKVSDIGKIPGVFLRRGLNGKIMGMYDDGESCISFPALGQAVYVSKPHSQKLRTPIASSSDNTGDMVAYQALVSKQQEKLAGIMRELQTSKRKVTHWAWWVFPTEKAGDLDPDGTRVTRTTAAMLLKHGRNLQDWRRVLELICDLVEDRGMHILPAVDYGRVHWFIDFWSSLDASPEWMISICNRLGRFEWGS